MSTFDLNPRIGSAPLVALIVLNWNGALVTPKCVESILSLTDYPRDRFKVVVVDNGSSDDSIEILRCSFPGVVDIVKLPENTGYASGNNQGIKYCLGKYEADYLVLLNNDTEIVQADWLSKLVSCAKREPRIALVGPRLVFPDGRVQWSARRRDTGIFHQVFETISVGFNPGVGMQASEKIDPGDFVGEASTVSGACMLISSDFVRKHGLLDESLSPFFGEDVEYCLRAWSVGLRVYYRGDVYLVHYQSFSFEGYPEMADEKFMWVLRNGLIVSRRYFGLTRTLAIGIPISLMTLLVDKRQKTLPLSPGNLRLRRRYMKKMPLLLKAFTDFLR